MLFVFKVVRVGVNLRVDISSKEHSSVASNLNISRFTIGKQSPLSRLRSVCNPVSKCIDTFTSLFKFFRSFLFSIETRIRSTFSDVIISTRSSNLTPETHISSSWLLCQLFKWLLNHQSTEITKANSSMWVKMLVVTLEIRNESACCSTSFLIIFFYFSSSFFLLEKVQNCFYLWLLNFSQNGIRFSVFTFFF